MRGNADTSGARGKALEIIESFGKPPQVAALELNTVRLATHGDNVNFFGLNPAYRGEKGSDLFEYFWKRYSMTMTLPSKPAWSEVADGSIVRELSLEEALHAPEPQHDFAYCQAKDHQRVLSKKSVSVRFPSGGASLSDFEKRIIEEKFGHLAEIYFEDCIRLTGHTDDQGSRAENLELSRRRAESVKRYLVDRYRFDPRRIITVGKGPDQPVASNQTAEGRDQNRRTDFELLH